MVTILSINNDSKILENLKKVAKENDYKLIKIDDPQKGLEYAKENIVDLIIVNALNEFAKTDEIVRTLKSKETTREIPILFTYDYFKADWSDVDTFDKALRIEKIPSLETDYKLDQIIKKLLAEKEKDYSGLHVPLDTLERPYYEYAKIFFYTKSSILLQHWFGGGFNDPKDELLVFELEPNDDFKKEALKEIKDKLHFLPSDLEYIDKYFMYIYSGKDLHKDKNFIFKREDTPQKIDSYNLAGVYYTYKAQFPGLDAFKDYILDKTWNKVNIYLAFPNEAKKHCYDVDGEIIDSIIRP